MKSVSVSHLVVSESLFVIPWFVARQAPLSMELSRQEYCSGLSCPLPGALPDPGMKPASLMSLFLASRFFTAGATWEALNEDGAAKR